MSYCKIYQDWPLRAKVTPKGVVHAARPKGTRWTDEFHKDTDTFIACAYSWRRKNVDNRLISITADNSITCKNCLRELGDTDYKKEISERFVIMDKDGFFMKSQAQRTGELADANLFKTKAPAIGWITQTIYFNGAGEEIDFRTWLHLGRENMPRRPGKRLIKGYRIFKATMQLGEEVRIEVDR
jgi:hypothetical protein